MLFRFMFRVMLQCLLRKPMVLQHIENLNAVSVVRDLSGGVAVHYTCGKFMQSMQVC
jgi:nucleoside diphosphate kinase